MAVQEARSEFGSVGVDPVEWCACAERILKGLRLPPKRLLRLYLSTCVFSVYEVNGRYRFQELGVPEFLHAEVDSFYDSISQPLWLFGTVYPFLRVAPIRLWPDIESMRDRPLPPAIWNEADVDYVLSWELHHSPLGSVCQRIRECYGPFFLVLPQDHPLSAIGRGTKRRMDDDVALQAASMKDKGAKYREIGERYGWRIQGNEYGEPSRCQTARRYVHRGRKQRATDRDPANKSVEPD